MVRPAWAGHHALIRARRRLPWVTVPRSRALRLSAWIAGALVLVLVAAVVLVAAGLRQALPQHSGTIDVPGLSGEVTVLRDERGVPSLVAEDAEDLFRAQGFVHAQDRFFEMDYRRHVTAGRLSELVGANETALDADRVIRTFGWRDVAEAELPLLDADTRLYLQAYADGVNAYLENRSPVELAVEYRVLGMQVDLAEPEPWDPVDSLAWLKAMAWDLKGNYNQELGRATTYATLRDVALVEDLYPRYPQETNLPVLADPAAAPASAPAAPADDLLLDPELVDALDAVEDALGAVPHLLGEGEGIGSNSWVVAGDLTASGAPMLANDPHLSISAPGIWSQMGLYCAEQSARCPFAVSGFTFAGFPGVIIGHNDQLAWGLTNLGADVIDFFLERVDDEAGTYVRDGEPVPLETRTETIEVAGGDPVELEVRTTVHGPIVSDVLGIERAHVSPTLTDPSGAAQISMAWTALEPNRTADAVFAFNTAADAEDIAAAAALFAVPSQNIVYATTDGHIGYQAPGLIPVRARVTDGPVPSDGSWPRPGWDSRYDWQGYVDPATMPAVQDPAAGYVVAANQAVQVSTAEPFLTGDWDYGYRAQRIRERLEELVEAGTPIDAAAMADIQDDAWNPYAEALLPTLLSAPVEDQFTREAVDLLREWDGVQSADSAAAAYFASVWENLLEATFWDDLPESQWPSGDSRWLQVVVQLLEEPESPWWDDRRTVNVVESRNEVLARTLTTARLELTVELGKDADDWEWGSLHTAAPEHPVLGGESVPWLVRQVVNPEPRGVDGGSSIVDATAWDASTGSFGVTAAPSMRMVVDMADLDASTWITLTGTSGHPASPHYADQFGAWAAGETFPWPFTLAAVREASEAELTLRPAG